MGKVICIDASERGNPTFFPNWIEEGETYTIRDTENGMHGRVRVLLEEVENPKAFFPELGGKTEPGFNMNRFVPVEDGELEESNSEVEELVETLN